MATAIGDRYQVLTDKQWELLELLLPKSQGHVGRNFANNRLIVEGMLYRLQSSLPGRDLPELRAVANGLETPPPLRRRRHLGPVLTALITLADTTGDLSRKPLLTSGMQRIGGLFRGGFTVTPCAYEAPESSRRKADANLVKPYA
ncbi:transposase [Nocardia sp. JMUB6875]|uniref:transposase n=1 Tax=Nocardia sp. JMUB6875 TaxID=3158170 RepID=UPI0034E85E7C